MTAVPSGLYFKKAWLSWLKVASPYSDWLSTPRVKVLGIVLPPACGSGVDTAFAAVFAACGGALAALAAMLAGGVWIGAAPVNDILRSDAPTVLRKRPKTSTPKTAITVILTDLFIIAPANFDWFAFDLLEPLYE